jgi:hypothetical protein
LIVDIAAGPSWYADRDGAVAARPNDRRLRFARN